MIIVQKTVRLADPHVCTDSCDRLGILDALFDTLLRRDRAGRFVGGLARRWTVAADARTWRFELAEGARFHDGRPLRAADVVASIERASAPEIGGELGTEGVWASYLGDAELSAPAAHSVRMVTGRPMADLAELLVDIPILPRDTGFELAEPPVGSGPYRLTERGDGRLRMAAFPDCATRRAEHAELVWEAVVAEADRIDRIRDGTADLACGLSPAGAAAAEGAGLQIHRQPSTVCVAFLFNARSGPGADRRIRQAVNHAVDVQRLIDRCLDGAASRLNGPLTELHWGHDPALPPYPYDPARARALLAAVGTPLKLTIDVPTELPDEAPALATGLAGDLAAVGIRTEIRQFSDRPAYAEHVKAGRIGDLACFDSSPAGTYRVLREKLDSSVTGPWWQGYHNAEVNRILATASATPDDGQRRTHYRAAYAMLRDDAPWLFLYHPTLSWCTATDGTPPSIGRTGRVEMVRR